MDNNIRILLKDNPLKIQSEDFTSQTLQKIHGIQEELRFKRKIRWLCLFTGVNVLIIPIGFILLSKLTSISYPHLIMLSIQGLRHSLVVQLSIAIAVALILLFELDNLIRMIMNNSKIPGR